MQSAVPLRYASATAALRSSFRYTSDMLKRSRALSNSSRGPERETQLPWVSLGSYDFSRNSGSNDSRAKFGKSLALQSIIFAIHGKDPPSDVQRLEQAMAELARFPRHVKSIHDAHALLLSRQSSESAYMIYFKGSWMFELFPNEGRKIKQHASDNPGAQASSAWTLGVYDPRATGIPGDWVDSPLGLTASDVNASFHELTKSSNPLPVFCLDIIRSEPSLGHLLREIKAPYAQITGKVDIKIHGTLENSIAAFTKDTIPVRHLADGPDLSHSSRPRLVAKLVEEIDVGLASITPNMAFHEGPKHLHGCISRNLNKLLPGGTPEVLEVGVRHLHTRYEFHYKGRVEPPRRRK